MAETKKQTLGEQIDKLVDSLKELEKLSVRIDELSKNFASDLEGVSENVTDLEDRYEEVEGRLSTLENKFEDIGSIAAR